MQKNKELTEMLKHKPTIEEVKSFYTNGLYGVPALVEYNPRNKN